jgi:hypothetical protein
MNDDEIEMRVAALELLLTEFLAHASPELLQRLAAGMGEGMADPVDGRERAIRQQAIQHITDATRRFQLFSLPRRPGA